MAKNDYDATDEVERALLGALIVDNSLIGEVSQLIDSDDFFYQRNKIIYSAVVYKFSCGEAADIITIRSYLMDKGQYAGIGGSIYLSDIVDAVPDVANAMHYAEEVKKAALKRSLSSLSNTIKSSLDKSSPHEIIDTAMASLIGLSNRSADTNQIPIGDLVTKEVDYLISLMGGGSKEEVVYTGYKQLDEMIGGMKEGEMYVLAARPSLGKTALATNIAINVAKTNTPVLFFSMEMGRRQLVKRILSFEAGIPFRAIESGVLSEARIEKLRATRDTLRTLPLVIDDNARQTLSTIRAKCRRQAAKSGLGLIIVDYIQLGCDNSEDRTEIAMWSKGLRAIGKDLGVPVLPIAQLNRYVDHRDDPRPMMADLRGSGQIEQDADVIMFLFNKDDTNRLKTTLYLAKQRNGPCGDIELVFDNEVTLFEER